MNDDRIRVCTCQLVTEYDGRACLPTRVRDRDCPTHGIEALRRTMDALLEAGCVVDVEELRRMGLALMPV